MTSRQKVLQRRKTQLLHLIESERNQLQLQSQKWQQLTAPIDHSWYAIMRYRPIVLGATAGIIAIVGLRKPLRILRWSRRALSLWSSYQLFKQSSAPQQK